MRGAVSELSRALARLFEMIRADRADQRDRIAELERALATAQARVAELESGEVEVEAPIEAPAGSDFDQLRVAAERLRRRTEQMVQEAGTPAAEARREEEARVEAARRAVDASIAEDESDAAVEPATGDASATGGLANQSLPVTPVHDEPFGEPGILRVFPGAVLGRGQGAADDDLDVESDLELDEAPRQAVATRAVPAAEPAWNRPSAMADVAPSDPSDGSVADAASAAATRADAGSEAVDDAAGEVERPQPQLVRRPEPVAVAPRSARKRRAALRRRRIDARKLAGVDPGAALRAMVGSIDPVWTAGCPLDLVVALTDGGAMRIAGGDLQPLRVEEVEPGAPARSTVTATSAQVVPLFGRLALSDEQSAPLIHGTRRDADLLVGWIDRAQRLAAEPL